MQFMRVLADLLGYTIGSPAFIRMSRILGSETFKSKNQIAGELVSKASQKGVPFSHVVGDSAYLNIEIVTLIESLKKSWVFGCKSDRVVAMPGGRWISLSEWAKTVPRNKFKRVSVRYEKRNTSTTCQGSSI